MRVLMVGAGAVGSVLTRAIEQTKSHDVTYLVRPGRKKSLTRVKLLDARSGTITVREKPSVLEAGDPLPIFDTVIFAVRGDQLDEAMHILDQLPRREELRVATASAGLDDVVRLRARLPGRPVAQIVPMFLAYPEHDVIKWWNPPLGRTQITWEGDPDARAFAEELAATFQAGGLPSRARNSLGRARDAIFAAGMPLLGTLELAGWDFAAWAQSAELRGLASTGLREGVAAMAPPTVGRLAGLAPQAVLAAMLRVAPRMLTDDVRAMWRVHGPKIAGQTRHMLDQIIARGSEQSRPTAALVELRRRLGQ
jgi:ketopantoate reductase